MSIHTKAPLRIDFAGAWSVELLGEAADGGCAVNAAISLHVNVDFLLGGKKIRINAEDRREHETIASSGMIVYNGKLDRYKACLNLLPVTGGIEILSNIDAPTGAGLGESAALDAALLSGLATGREEQFDPADLIEMGVLVEKGELGLRVGLQDFYPAIHGGFQELQLTEGKSQHRHLSLDEDAQNDLLDHLVLFYTGESFFKQEAYDRICEVYDSGDSQATDSVLAIRDLAREAGKVLEVGDWQRLAYIVREQWKLQQLIDQSSSTPYLFALEEACYEAGAWGVKPLGYGCGGCMLAVCASMDRKAIASAASVHNANIIDFSFASDGVAVWRKEDADNNN